MKVYLINNLFPPAGSGGAEKVVEMTAQGLLEKGHEVFVITLGRSNVKCPPDSLRDSKRAGQMSGVRVYQIKVWNIFSYLDIQKKPVLFRLIWWFFNIFNLSGARQVKKILKQEKPDLVHMHNLTGISFLLPRMIRKLGIKQVQILHDIQLAYPSGQLIYGHEKDFINNFFLRKWYEKIVRKLIGSPEVVISPSKWLLEFYEKRGYFKNSYKVVVKNPVSIKNNLPITDYQLPITFLFVGKVEEYKGILFLIKIFVKCQMLNVKCQLHIVGDGKDLKKAKKLAEDSDNIVFHGALEKDKLEDIYRESDVLLMPTLTYENCPMVILESLSHGLPVVASRLGGVGELVTPGKTGWLFEAGNSNEFIDIIKDTVEDYGKIKEMKEECVEAAKEYSLEKYIEKLEEIYK